MVVGDESAPAPSITFETKVWEGDYRIVLDEVRLGRAIAHNSWSFASRIVYVNNVDNSRRVLQRGRRLVDNGVLDDVVLVDDHAQAALDHFGLSKSDLGRGYVYSISELVSLFLCETDYLLHFAGDTMLREPADWVPPALDLLGRRPDVAVVNVSWTPDVRLVEAESSARDGDFLLGYGFSDQMYLVRSAEFEQRIYAESHPDSARYPEYGGELFEKRVDAWMRNHKKLRATWTASHYVHENIRHPRSAAQLALAKVMRVAGR